MQQAVKGVCVVCGLSAVCMLCACHVFLAQLGQGRRVLGCALLERLVAKTPTMPLTCPPCL